MTPVPTGPAGPGPTGPAGPGPTGPAGPGPKQPDNPTNPPPSPTKSLPSNGTGAPWPSRPSGPSGPGGPTGPGRAALVADAERMLAEPFDLLVAATADCDDPQLRNELGDVARLLYLARHVLSRIELPARHEIQGEGSAVATAGGLGPNLPARLVADSRLAGLGSNPPPARGGTCVPALGMGREGDMVTALAAGSGQAPPCLAADAGGNASNASAPGVGFTLPRPPEFSIGSALIGGAR